MKRSIIWFKSDLRLHDNETLVEAIAHSDEVIPIYCLDENWDKEVGKFQKTGNFRKQFIIESLIDLDENLRKKGSGLWILRGNPSVEIPKFAALNEVHKVYTKKEISSEEKQTLLEVEEALWKHKCVLETFSTSTLYHAVDLPFAISQIPDLFSQFRKRTEHESSIRPIVATPEKIQSPVIPLLKVQHLDFPELPIEKMDERAAVQFKGGETEALKRLNYYLFESKLLLKYKETRNGLIGGDYSSKFSPWLATGSISPRYIYHEIKRFETENQANESTYWLIFELLWRDFFRFMFKKHGAKFFKLHGFNQRETAYTGHDETVIQAWIDGKTGDDFVDANMRELKLTGFMSNRGRQNVASYFIDQLKQDWRIGARYFEQQLVDYDASSNWGNWAYQAGAGNDPRGKRVFDTQKQAKDYDGKKEYRKLWLDR